MLSRGFVSPSKKRSPKAVADQLAAICQNVDVELARRFDFDDVEFEAFQQQADGPRIKEIQMMRRRDGFRVLPKDLYVEARARQRGKQEQISRAHEAADMGNERGRFMQVF